VVEGRISELSPVISGVPQGTVLGPILFLLHIADIARGVSPSTRTSSYVDDTRVSRSISEPASDCQSLQNDLASIYSWAVDVNMVFNSDKFECLRFWPGKSSKPSTGYTSPDGSPIEEKDHLRDLGVEIGTDLTFSTHIQNTVAAANKLIGWALRTFRRRSKLVMMTIWKSLVQSKLDYCSQLWSPSDQASISKLEGVARHFTAQVAGLQDLDYWDRLRELHLYSQERRRERYQIIFIWKCLQGYVQGYPINTLQSPRRGRLIEVSPLQNQAPAAVKKAREASLSVKGARLFNLIPRDLRDTNTGTVDQFKFRLDEWLATVPDQPTIQGRQRAASTNSLLDQVLQLPSN
jgi:ribonuclease P/MRP protein subunit RPP40